MHIEGCEVQGSHLSLSQRTAIARVFSSQCCPRGSRGGYPLAALGSEDWCNPSHGGVRASVQTNKYLCLASTHTALVSSPSLTVLHLPTSSVGGCSVGDASSLGPLTYLLTYVLLLLLRPLIAAKRT